LEIGADGSYDFTLTRAAPTSPNDGIPDGDFLIVSGQPSGQSNSNVCGAYKKLATGFCNRPAYQQEGGGTFQSFLYHCNGQWVIAHELNMLGNGVTWRCFSSALTPDQAVATGDVWETGMPGGGVVPVNNFRICVQTAKDRYAVRSRNDKIREEARALGSMTFVGYAHGPNAARVQGVFELTEGPQLIETAVLLTSTA
jgi:hypothetical protein